MKKLFLVFSIVLLAIAAVAQSKFYVYKTDGSATEFLINDVDSISFVAPTTGVENGYEWVDLGLPSGLRWATCNVGADSPEEYGSYFAWGEVEPKSTYSWSTYKWMTTGMSSWTGVNKYTFADGQTSGVWYDNSGNFIGDNKTTLDSEDDAAAVNMGGSWRMPTKEEIAELIDECTWKWTTLNGVNGHNVEGPNGNSIFLPAAGYRDDSGLYYAGSGGGYWSSSLDTGSSNYAYYFYFNSDYVDWHYYGRFGGQSVRGVCESEINESPRFTIAALSSDLALGEVIGGGVYTIGTEVSLVARAKRGGRFLRWSDEVSDSVRTIIVTANTTYTAIFEDLTSGIENGYEWVDLGLPSGLRWATCNVGADSVHHYGNYYAWGETAPKSSYNSSTYTYNYSSNPNTLPLSNDAASVNMGGSWRIPTYDEIEELKTECTWTWTNDYNGTGVAGRIVTSKINGNSIFLPAAGWCSDSGLRFTGSNGGYWSSSLSTDSPIVQGLNFSSLNVGWRYYGLHYLDYEGLSVRGVCAATSTPAASKGIGAFSVSADKQVAFSPGNLQYIQSSDTWQFASCQWECVGTDNVTGGEVRYNEYGYYRKGTALADKVDLFGWSTSANNFGVSTSTRNANDYSGSFVDWGVNQIGSDAPNTWRTLTYDEWDYLRNSRPNASSLRGVAQVNGVNGLILLPDNWTCPNGITFKSGFHSSNHGVEYYAAYQTFTAVEWSKMESAGAVFLPATGLRSGSEVPLVQYESSYWSATEYDSDRARSLFFCSSGSSDIGGNPRCYGFSVRLVKDL